MESMTVAQTEALVADMLAEMSGQGNVLPQAVQEPVKTRKRPSFLINDVRFFLNTIQNGLSMMQAAGVPAACTQEEAEDSILLTIRIPKRKP